MAEILCLANSRKDDERCVAGIELSSGRLIRPVAKTESQAIPADWTRLDGSPLVPLDVVDIPLLAGNARVPFQGENRYCPDGWRRTRTEKPPAVLKYCESDSTILHTRGSDPILERYFKLGRLPQTHWKSLQVIQARNVEFHEAEPEKWKARFITKNRQEYDLRLTNDRFTQKLSRKRRLPKQNEYIFLLSLTRPWKHFKAPRCKPFRCYKLIAGVIPLT